MTPPTFPRRKPHPIWHSPHPVWRAVVEVVSIVFLFYSNLLMGEFTGVNGRGKTLGWALHDIFTEINLTIALISAVIGYAVFEFWRRKLM
jgi:hypothetical protein